MATGDQMLALGQQLGQVLYENQALSNRVDRLEEILMMRGAATLGPTSDEPEAAAPLNPMAEFAGIGAQAKDFLSQFQPAAPPPAPPKPT